MSSSNKQPQSNINASNSVNNNKTAELMRHFDELVFDYNKLKTSLKSSSVHLPFSALTSLVQRIQRIFLCLHKRNITTSSNKEENLFSEDTYLLKNSETLIEILVYIGSFFNKNYDSKSSDFYSKYFQSIANLAETTPIRFGNSLIALNKLVEYSIELAFLLTQDLSSNKQLMFDVLRCLGALTYQNGSNLNNLNLNRLFGTCEHYSKSEFNEKTHGLLFTIRRLTDNDLNSEFNLISTQILFNLTMSSQNDLNPYIDDKYKVNSIYLLVRILRLHSLISLPSEDSKVNNCKILTKSLQALENIFLSMQNLYEQSNWTQMFNFHLGDILAVAKNLTFHGIVRDSTSRKQLSSNEEKLQPSNVSIILDNNKKNKADDDHRLSDDEDRQLNNSANSNSKKPNSKNNSNNKRFTKTKPNQHSKQIALTETSLNSVQCLRDHQVPLLQLSNKNSNAENPISDSDLSADSNSTSKFYIEKCNAKVRVAALGVLLTAFQSLDKRTVLSYWDSFLGQSSNSKNYNLIWSVRNDQSPKVRLIASTTLSTYLECARSFFSLAACDNTSQTASLNSASASFVPMSYSIALLIRQLHSDLNYALNIESFSLNQIQLLKCLQCLIKATPYHKLKPGLVYKLMTSLHCQLYSKLKQNKNEQLIVEILTCLLLILTNHHQLAEVHLALISNSMRRDSNSRVVAPPPPQQPVADDLDSLSEKLEQISSVFKVPNLTQSRVTYFYTNEPTNTSQSYKSSLNESLNASGQMTPLFADLIGQEPDNTQKSWLVSYCLKYYSIMSSSNHKLVCLDLLQIICKKYFDLVRRDLFFDDLTQLILANLDLSFQLNQESEQILLKTLKLLEEFARCLATDDLRTISNIDLNDCCKFWSSLLNSKLISHILTNEQCYLLSSSACDCLASIGASIFELLPFQKRIYCLTNLLHLTKSNSSLIRSSSVRALGVYVTFSSLKEDQNFLNDLSQCLLGLLSSDQNNLVRQKAAWSLSNLSEVLVENEDKLGKAFTDDFNLVIWMRLLDASSSLCVRESDKLKSYLVRTIGNLIRYITVFDTERIIKELKDVSKLEKLLTRSIETLCQCRSVKMLKVKWNLSHAIGVAMHSFSTWQLQKSNTQWLLMFYDTLLDLFTQSTNFKVRINACIALMSINLADKTSNIYLKLINSTESIFVKLWICLIDAFGKILNEHIIDTTNELQHKTTLIHQLCKLFTYLCKNLRIEDLNELMLKCLNNVKSNSQRAHETFECLTLNRMRSFFVEYIRNIFDQIDQNKQEVQYYNEALTQLNFLNSNKQNSLDEDCIQMLSSLLQKVTARKTESESSDTESVSTDADYRKKFPFSQVYD